MLRRGRRSTLILLRLRRGRAVRLLLLAVAVLLLLVRVVAGLLALLALRVHAVPVRTGGVRVLRLLLVLLRLLLGLGLGLGLAVLVELMLGLRLGLLLCRLAVRVVLRLGRLSILRVLRLRLGLSVLLRLRVPAERLLLERAGAVARRRLAKAARHARLERLRWGRLGLGHAKVGVYRPLAIVRWRSVLQLRRLLHLLLGSRGLALLLVLPPVLLGHGVVRNAAARVERDTKSRRAKCALIGCRARRRSAEAVRPGRGGARGVTSTNTRERLPRRYVLLLLVLLVLRRRDAHYRARA